jgi:DNA-directed RNA polymerase subunit RPC12/RpoP
MSSRCPNCKWTLGFFANRPKSGETILCPSCGSKIRYAGYEEATRTLMVAAFFAFFIVIRFNDGNETPFVVAAFLVCIAIFSIGRSAERFELDSGQTTDRLDQ